MKIYVTHSSHFDYQNELYIPLRKSPLNTLHEITLPHEHTTDQFNSKEYIKHCSLILAEVSYPSTGQGIELGWANVFDVPIMCFYKKNIHPPDSLKGIANVFIEYDSPLDMIQKLTNFLSTFQS